MSRFAWEPTGSYLERSRVRQFMDRHGIGTWQELVRRSAADIDWFWAAAMDHLGVEWFEKYTRLRDDSAGMPWNTWFLNGRLNITHNCIDRHVRDGLGGAPALWFEADDGAQRRWTFSELQEVVTRLASGLERAGVRKGQRVAMCMPISPESVAVMFAALKMGAACMQLPARLPAAEVAARLEEGQPRVLFINDAYPRAGKWTHMEGVYQAAVERAPSVQHIVVYERQGNGLASRPKCLAWDAFVCAAPGAERAATQALDSEHPSLILYSSGTTGKPKTIVHTHAGALAQSAKEVGYAFDCHARDVFYWFTNFGWMMAPWELIGALFFGASVVLYEGTHLFPTPHRLFELMERYGISIFGCTPSVLRELASRNVSFEPQRLASLRILGSTGSVLDAPTWKWFFNAFGGGRCPIINISGGTEIIGSMLAPLPVMPLKPGTVGAPGLGMDVDAVNPAGQSVRGEAGSLVCRKPFPSMTRGFLGDPERYLQTYFPNRPDCWVHGDLVRVDEDGYWYILGRADDLIVRAGVKHDPAKLEEKLLEFPGPPRVQEAVAIGADDAIKGERIVCFVVLEGEGAEATEEFKRQLGQYVRKTYDPLARPDDIFVVRELPVTHSAKIPRKTIRHAYEGKPLGNLAALTDPQALDEIRRLGQRAAHRASGER